MNWKQEVESFKSQMKPEVSAITARSITFAFFGSVGGGKSVTAGIHSIGITPGGSIGWVDGEGRRSAWAIDIVATKAMEKYGGSKADWIGRFKVIYVDAPFNPLKVIAALESLTEAGCKTVIMDVMSQAWDSEGGYLDLKDERLNQMAGDDEAKKKRSAAAAAAAIKPWTHQKMVNAITSAEVNLTLLFQSKKKFNVSTSKPNEFESPIQESGLTRTALAVGFVQPNDAGEGGFCSFQLPLGQGTKTTHPSILSALPRNGEQYTFDHAEAILKICGGTVPESKPNPEAAIKQLKAKLWTLTMVIHEKDRAKLEQWLWDNAILDPTLTLDKLTEGELLSVISLTEKKLK